MAAGYQRKFYHYAADAVTFVGEISERAIAGCWFELHRQGGCGAGELRLRDDFPDRQTIDVEDWIACEYAPGERWYFGRVETRESELPSGVRLRLHGMGVELGEVFPGGFGTDRDGVPPHRYARTDLFPHDPDRPFESIDSVETPSELVRLLLTQYVVPATHVAYNPARVVEPLGTAPLDSYKFRGEESVGSILKDLAFRARHNGWGVDETGTFFFEPTPDAVVATFRCGVDVVRLEETRDRDLLFNRVSLTGDYVYGDPIDSSNGLRGFSRWRGNYLQPESRERHGDRRIRLWIPWLRTANDSRAFVREFFRVYAEPTTRYLVEVADRTALVRPWSGKIRLLDREGNELIAAWAETIRVTFDRTPRLRMELGPGDPRTLWPEPPHDERWEIARHGAGGDVTVTSTTSTPTSSTFASSDGSSSMHSWESSEEWDSSHPDSDSSIVSSGLDSDGDSSQGASSPGDESSSRNDESSTGPVSSGSESGEASDSSDGNGSHGTQTSDPYSEGTVSEDEEESE